MVQVSESRNASVAWVRPAARWILPHVPSHEVEKLQNELKLHRLAAAVLVRRGLTEPDAVRDFLSPRLDTLHDPFSMRDMERAAARLWSAIQNREPIVICGDYDVDGTCSVVLLKKTIEILGGAAEFHIPHRLKEGYGIHQDVIDEASRNGIRLIISVDTGIRANAVVHRANAAGIDVIVTDHHLPDAELPPGFAVLNPNRPDCEYPNKYLCGAGVTLKLIQALLKRSGMAQSRQSALLGSFLKIAALATVADIVPLTGENRVIVSNGLSGLREVRNAGLRALLEVAGLATGEAPSAHQVAFRVAPRINAAGRMATARDVIHLFLTADETQARELAGKLDALNRERQETEAAIIEQILEECEQRVNTGDAALVFAAPGWHLGVLGIVASRLVERFCRPCFVLSDASESAGFEAGSLTGSGRSIPAFHLLQALESMPDLFHKFGGHRQAAGLTLRPGALEDFQKRFAEFAAAKLEPSDLCPEYTIDALAELTELNDTSTSEVLSLGPFGFGNSNPIFCAQRIQVAGAPRVLSNGKHLTIPLLQNGRMITCKAWNFGDRISLFQPGAFLDILFQIENDPFARSRGEGSWCVSLKDAKSNEQSRDRQEAVRAEG
ncbi:MAG TPA: single-stranded-DNA-specific exonuclease RecJ [Bryobacteraceae bacterium]|jgi:single-stranded-DNA-specific exonuclease|nr:single-stranded-DNA-specific exonuclease RecJ [Bryobacteraceae bacterium]